MGTLVKAGTGRMRLVVPRTDGEKSFVLRL